MEYMCYIIIKSMLGMNVRQQPFCVVEMEGELYPFGQLKETVGEEQVVLVHKKLVFHSQRELQILKKMSAFLQGLESEFLISLHHSERSSDNKYHFYYEYAPLTMERWILDLGDDVLEELQFEMLNLANFLTQQGIKFKFNPSNLGLSKDIKVKYFLSEFAIDDKKLNNYKEVEEDIVKFFGDFRDIPEDKQKEQSSLLDRKSADSANLFGSNTTRESWEVKSSKSSNSARAMMAKNSLKEKIENSKKKSLEILSKLKNMKANQ